MKLLKFSAYLRCYGWPENAADEGYEGCWSFVEFQSTKIEN